MMKALDKETAVVLSGWLTNLSAGWFGAIFILPLFLDSNRVFLLIVNLPSAILALIGAIWLEKKGKSL